MAQESPWRFESGQTAPLNGALSGEPTRWQEAWRTRIAHHEPVVHFDRPMSTVPVSLTGADCALNCAHCAGTYLRHMHPIWDARADRATSCLISGGCDPHGRVPVTRHADLVAELRRGRKLNWHLGLIEEPDLRRIADMVDVVSFDIVGDSETVREVYGLDLCLNDYMQTLDLVQKYVPVVPHITIGLRGGRTSGEHAALQALSRRDLEALILIVLIPTEGTAFASCSPPSLDDVADVFLEARTALPTTHLFLGCMRPSGQYRHAVDELAIRAGMNGIVNPSRKAERTAVEMGLRTEWGDECCALHFAR